MSGIDNLKTRLQYNGGNAEGRMQKAKLETLKKSLLYSYQAATAILEDGREFRCLINPDKNKMDYDDKIISIPFEDICLNKERIGKTTKGLEVIGMKPGDIFTWKETGTDWLVYLQRLEEDAYFRAEIRRCDYEIEIDGTKYKVYAKGPTQDNILWHTRRGAVSWNDNDYDLELYITHNEETDKFFHRFTIINFNGKPWEVQAIDNITTQGIIQVRLKETFQNTIQNEALKEKEEIKNNKEEIDIRLPHIDGDSIVNPYDIKEYQIINADGGEWEIDNDNKARIVSQTDKDVKVNFITGRSGTVNLIYKRLNKKDIVFEITIQSF